MRMAGVGRTGSEVEGDVLGFARGGALARAARGGLYRGGCRPPDSRAEDIVVTFTAGLLRGVRGVPLPPGEHDPHGGLPGDGGAFRGGEARLRFLRLAGARRARARGVMGKGGCNKK